MLVDSSGYTVCPDCGQTISQYGSHECPITHSVAYQFKGDQLVAIDETTPALGEINETLKQILEELREIRKQIPPTPDT